MVILWGFFCDLQRIFNKIIWRLADPPEEEENRDQTNVDDKDDDPLRNSANFLKIIYDLCKYINFDDLDDNSTISMLYLPSTYNDLIPNEDSMNAILAIDFLPTVSEYGSEIFGVIPQHYHHSELVWPVPYDFTPHNIFDVGKYDVNLTFGNEKYQGKWRTSKCLEAIGSFWNVFSLEASMSNNFTHICLVLSSIQPTIGQKREVNNFMQ